MADLRTRYMKIDLKNPVILASSPITASLDQLKRAEDAGYAAVVLKSIFEEFINSQSAKALGVKDANLNHADAYGFLEQAAKEYQIDKYLTLVEKAKKALGIPVIASINCSDQEGWLEYAKRFEAVGADGLELNYYIVASNARIKGSEIDKSYLNLVKHARLNTSLPLSIKIGSFFSSPSNMIRAFSDIGVDGQVLFNSFLQPDIDIERLSLAAGKPLESKGDYGTSLRWVALMSAEIQGDLCAATGIRDGETVVKMLLAGASAVQVCTAAMKSLDVVKSMTAFIAEWMDRKGFKSIYDFKGKLAQEHIENPELWERAQYVKALNS